MATYEGLPVLFSGTATLQSSSPGNPNNLAFVNTTGSPVEIYKIAIYIGNSAATDQTVSGSQVLMSLNSPWGPITNGFIPVFCFGRMRQFWTSEVQGTPVVQGGGLAVPSPTWGEFTWRLSNPIPLEPGQALQPLFKHSGSVPNQITVRAVFFGRTRSVHFGKEINLPYVAAWNAPQIDMSFQTNNALPSTYTVEYASSETDLQNTTDNVLYVESLIGRIVSRALPDAPPPAFTVLEENRVTDPLIFVQARSSEGYDMIPLWTPFRLAFSQSTRELPCNLRIHPGQYILIEVKTIKGSFPNNPLNVPPITNMPVDATPYVSMIGYRKVSR